MAIRILDAGTIGKISAGEVVERPSSVVKELMENSIDAGATSITVEIKDGGIRYLRVTDNGCGIPFQEARLAFENHATSKLKNADGLWDIRTLGFRGEALPSIAAVSRVSLTTRVKGADFGAKVEVEGGSFSSIAEAGCPEGTTLVMRDLFFNLPVRRAFLKKPAYEQGLVTDVVQKLILGNPGVSIRMISMGKTLFQSAGDGEIRHAALSVYGRECAQALLNVDAHEGAFALKGLIGAGDQARPTRAQQCFFINGRLIRCPILSQALEEACRGRVTIGMYPMCALSVASPAEAVDVNVHPSKLEVRFRDEAVFRLTAQSLLSRAFEGENMISSFSKPRAEIEHTTIVSRVVPLAEKPLVAKSEAEIPARSLADDKPVAKDPVGDSPRAFSSPAPLPSAGFVREAPLGAPRKTTQVPLETPIATPIKTPKEDESVEQTTLAPETLPAKEDEYRLIGTLFQTYILLEADGALLMIDQHAAHERLNFEDYKRRLDAGTASQQLLTPYILRVSRREAQILLDSRALLSESGYEIEPFGDADIQVRAVPFAMGQSDMRMLFTELIDSLDTLKSAEREKRMNGIMQASCKRAVKAGDRLTDGEIRSLIAAMRASGAPPTCPHGRPVLRALTKREIEKMFKRVN